jgi:hypothetical protein
MANPLLVNAVSYVVVERVEVVHWAFAATCDPNARLMARQPFLKAARRARLFIIVRILDSSFGKLILPAFYFMDFSKRIKLFDYLGGIIFLKGARSTILIKNEAGRASRQ